MRPFFYAVGNETRPYFLWLAPAQVQKYYCYHHAEMHHPTDGHFCHYTPVISATIRSSFPRRRESGDSIG